MAIKKVDSLDGRTQYADSFVTMFGVAAINADAWVAIDVNDTTDGRGNSVRMADADAAGDEGVQSRGMLCGIAMEATTAAGYLRIQVGGFHASARVDAGVVQGDRLIAGNTAGQARRFQDAAPTPNAAELQAALAFTVAGMALTDVAAGRSDVLLVDAMHLSEH